jgi:hypothetical protein
MPDKAIPLIKRNWLRRERIELEPSQVPSLRPLRHWLWHGYSICTPEADQPNSYLEVEGQKKDSIGSERPPLSSM